MSDHTPTPWNLWRYVYPNGPKREGLILMPEKADYGGGRKYVAVGGGNVEANAEYIVRACNAHDALVEACELALMDISCECDECESEGMAFSKCPVAVRYRQIKAAIALAQGR